MDLPKKLSFKSLIVTNKLRKQCLVEKQKKEYHPPLAFNINNVSESNSQKYLLVVLDNRLSFEDHLMK